MSRGRAPARAWECGGVARCNGYRRHLRLPIAGGPAPNGQVSWEAPPPGPRGEGCQRPPKSPRAAQLPQQSFSASQQLLRGRGTRAPSPRRAELGCQPRLLGARSPPPSLDRPSYLLKSLPVLCPLAAFVPSLAFTEAAWLPHVTRIRLLCPLCCLDPSRSAQNYAGFLQKPETGAQVDTVPEWRRGIPLSHPPRVPAPPSESRGTPCPLHRCVLLSPSGTC